jgi:hypothetical protein
MKRAVLLAAAVLLVACSAPRTAAAVVSPSPSPSPSLSPFPAVASASPSPSPSPDQSPTDQPPPSALPPSVVCTAKPTGGPVVLVGEALYDVTDPVHPKLLCTIRFTAVQLFTGDTFTYLRPAGGATQVILHSMGSGNENVVATFPIAERTSWGGSMAYMPDGSYAATATETDDSSGSNIHVWLASQRSAAEIRTFPLPLADCVCRFGLAPATLSFSPDGQYLASGWPIGKGAGAAPIEVQRVADQSVVKVFDVSYAQAIWGWTGHTLYVTGSSLEGGNVSAMWTPETNLVQLAGTGAWQAEPSLSPNGADVAYTAYANLNPPNETSIRVFVYDFAARKATLLINQLRSEVLFVKDGWVWYHEELPCPTPDGCTGQTLPGTKVFAMNVATGVETTVVFAAGASPEDLQSGWGGAEFWPNS